MLGIPEPTLSPLSVFFLLGVAQALFLAFALLTARKGNREANPYLAAMLIVFAVDLINEFLDSSLYGLQMLKLMFLTFPTDMLYGPLIWLYVRSMTGQSACIMGLRPRWHFLPFTAHAAVIWSNISITNDPQLLVKYPDLLLGNQIQPWIMNKPFALLAVVHIALYLSLSVITLRRYSVDVGNSFSYIEGVGLKWLHRLLIILFVLYILYVFRIIFAQYFAIVPYADVALNIGMVVVIYVLGYFGVQQTAIFTHLDQYEPLDEQNVINQRPHIESAEQEIATTKARSEQEKYAKSSLSLEVAQGLIQQLKEYMQQEKPYLDNKLNLAQLASLLGTSSNHLSQVINEQLSLSFIDFVNSYRVKAAKRQLIEMDPKRYTILGLALDSGFNSKSAFYNGFRKHTGMTPTQFRSERLDAG